MRDSKREQRPAPVLSLSLEQALRASDEILELLPIATCICDAAGRIVQYNRRAVELWGRAPQPGQTYDQFTAQCRFFGVEGERTAALQARRGAADRQSVRDEEVMVERADGKQRGRAAQHRSAGQRAGQAGRRDQLLPGRHRAQARGRGARSQPAGPAPAGASAGTPPTSTPRSASSRSTPRAASCASTKRSARSPA